MEKGRQNGWSPSLAVLFFSLIFATFSESRFFHALRSPVGSVLAHFWLPLAPFWLPLAPFWLPFGSFLDPFWFSFGSVWLFFSILEFIGLPFISLLSLLTCFRNLFVSFGKLLSLFLIQRRSDPINCLPIPACPIPRDPLACKLAFQGPEREYCRRQLRYDFGAILDSRGSQQ